MPEISRFLGIVIAMFYKDHNPPHFHATYGEHEIAVRIGDGEVLWGKLSAACPSACSGVAGSSSGGA